MIDSNPFSKGLLRRHIELRPPELRPPELGQTAVSDKAVFAVGDAPSV